jgi:hypothetical protein
LLRWLGFSGSLLLAVGGLASPLCAYLGLLLLIGAWWQLRDLVHIGSRWLTVTLIVWSAPLAIGPPLFSRDVYSYLAQGGMFVAGLDVYADGPAALGGPAAAQVPAMWQHTPAPYGPVFIRVAAAVAQVTSANVTAGVFGMRLIALLSLGVIAFCLPKLATACRADPLAALWLGALNPLVLLHLVAGAHNDALMLALLTAGLTAAVTRRFPLATVLVTTAALVKAPAALGLLAIAWLWSARNPNTSSAQPYHSASPKYGRAIGAHMASSDKRAGRVAKWVATAGIAVGTAVAITLVAGTGVGWLSVLDTPVSLTNWSLSSALGRLTGDVALWRWACLGVIALIAVGVWIRHRRPVYALGVTLAALALLGPALRPWYLLWGVIPLAATIPNRRWLAVASAVLALAVFPHGYPPDAHELTLAVTGGVLGLAILATIHFGERRYVKARRYPVVIRQEG